MIKIAVVEVPMTLFKIDVIIGGNKKEYHYLYKKRYGLDVNFDGENECCTVYSGHDSELKGEKRFCLKLQRHPKVITTIFIHELWHLIWQISIEISDIKLTKKTQTWGACFIETIAENILSAKYEKY